MATEIEAARLLIYRAALLKDAGNNVLLAAAQAKLKTGRLGPLRRGGRPDPRRLRLHRGVPGLPHVPRREDPHHRRGDGRGPAAGDRAGAGRVHHALLRVRVYPRGRPARRPPERARGRSRPRSRSRSIDPLARTGLPRLEVTSFVRADVIPQLSDAREVLSRDLCPRGVARSVLIPNPRGMDHALELRERFEEVGVFLRPPETHNRERQPLRRLVAGEARGRDRPRARRRPAPRPSSRRASAARTKGRFRASACSRSRRGSRRRAPSRSRSATQPGWPTRCRSRGSSRRRA